MIKNNNKKKINNIIIFLEYDDNDIKDIKEQWLKKDISNNDNINLFIQQSFNIDKIYNTINHFLKNTEPVVESLNIYMLYLLYINMMKRF